jgi:Domain of unknown function (DUF4804)
MEHNELFQNLYNRDIYIQNSWLLVPVKLLLLIKKFILFKKTHGSDCEKNFYKDKEGIEGIQSIILKLFRNRPLSFLGGSDSWTLKDSTDGFGGWETIGTDYEAKPLILNDYMSYDEIEISAFLSLSIFTPFINTGSRNNSGKIDTNCQLSGIYIGQAGARFERFSKMEWRYMIIDDKQNTRENGYGPFNEHNKNSIYLSIWANFYNVDHFPLFGDAINDTTGRFHKLNKNSYLDLLVYKKRMKIIAELFLKEADKRAKNINKKAFCHVVGLGLGAWGISSAIDIQTIISMGVYIELITHGEFNNISDLYFSWFNLPDPSNLPTKIGNIMIHMGHRNPGDPLNDDNKLLVANWAWDPNSYVGNEYWCGNLRTSGDPAAACSSFIAYIGNPGVCNISKIHTIDTNLTQ